MNTENQIEVNKWERVVLITQLVIAGSVFLVEIINNALLYVTRSQGYGPDTIVEKLIRYLFITSATNFGLVLIGWILSKKVEDTENRKYMSMFISILICTNVAFSHYQFACTLAISLIPIISCILYEDKVLLSSTMGFCLVGQTVAVIARARDPIYGKDIGPEAAIAYTYTISAYIFARIILTTLENRRNEVAKALIEAEKANANEERLKLSFKMLSTLARTIDAKDKYTNGHSARVAVYATILGEALGFDEKTLERLRYEALLHDIGKIGVPDEILNKPDKLTDAEFKLIKSHTLVGYDILKDMAIMPHAKDVAKYHHERYDGKGYPSNAIGNDIPLHARIVCIADSYDAMSSDRIYRKALSKEVIREELVNGRGTQFDPELLDVFLKLFDEHKLDVRIDSNLYDKADAEHEYVMEDIERILRNFSEIENNTEYAYRDFDKFYKYMRNVGIRYNHSIEVMSLNIIPKDGVEIKESDDVEAAEYLRQAIAKNVRAVDVYFKYTNREHIVILMDAGSDNINVIAQRVLFDFYASFDEPKYDVNYYLNEEMVKLQENG